MNEKQEAKKRTKKGQLKEKSINLYDFSELESNISIN